MDFEFENSKLINLLIVPNLITCFFESFISNMIFIDEALILKSN